MRTCLLRRIGLFAALLPLLWGCGDPAGGHRLGIPSHHGQDALAYQGQGTAAGGGTVPVSVVLGNGGGGASRTIAPEHIDQTALGDPGQYTLELTGTSDMGGSVSVPNFALRDGRGILALTPGAWTLRLTATPVPAGTGTAAGAILSGSTLLIVQDSPTTASITLTPLTGTGTVNVQFTLPQSVVKRLDPTTGGSTSKTVTVALYNGQNQVVSGTLQTFTVAAGTAAQSFTYTANGAAVASGRYTLRLSAPYTVNNASTGNRPVTYNLGWSDILYVENGRESTATVAILEARSSLGVPGNPHRRDKVNQANFTVSRSTTTTGYSANNIAGGTPQIFNPYEEGLWIYAANWDGGEVTYAGAGGNRGNTLGNEVLLIGWDPVYDADYYELEMLLHQNHGRYNQTNEKVYDDAKYDKLPATDADWDRFAAMPTLRLAFNGAVGTPNYYKDKTYTYNIRMANTTPTSFTFVAWRDQANGKNNGFHVATAGIGAGVNTFIGPPDTSTGLSRRGTTASYRIGLEGDCDALAVLVNSYAPQHWYGIRLRGVNRFGHSDWVYWKGGKN